MPTALSLTKNGQSCGLDRIPFEWYTKFGNIIGHDLHNVLESGKVIILGDFNIIFFDTSGFAYKRFVDILETFDCVQHIDKPTHNSGHLLD